MKVFSLAVILSITATPQLGRAQLLNSGGTELDTVLEQGREFVEARNWTAALDRFQQAAPLDPQNARISSGIGFIQAQHGNFQAAIAAYQQAVTLEPDNADFDHALKRQARCHLGIWLEVCGFFNDAWR